MGVTDAYEVDSLFRYLQGWSPWPDFVPEPQESDPGTLALSITTYAPTVLAPRLVTPGKLSLVMNLLVVGALAPRLVTPSPVALSLSFYTPTVLTPRLVTPGVLSLTLTGYRPDIAQRFVPDVLALVLEAFASTALAPRLVTPGTLALVTTKYAPNARFGDKRSAPGVLHMRLSLKRPWVSVMEPDAIECEDTEITFTIDSTGNLGDCDDDVEIPFTIEVPVRLC